MSPSDHRFGRRAAGHWVDFAERFAGSRLFDRVFKEGMGLVEETASYLDGPGRKEARGLERHAAIAYATESMRLTTRLMQLASWLLLQRALCNGELSSEEAHKERQRIHLSQVGAGLALAGSERLPDGLRGLIGRSLRLHDRILRLDAMLNGNGRRPRAGTSPVREHVDRLAAAFGAVRRG